MSFAIEQENLLMLSFSSLPLTVENFKWFLERLGTIPVDRHIVKLISIVFSISQADVEDLK